MRLITLQNLQPLSTDPLSFRGAHDTLLTINILKHDLIRISVRQNGEFRLDRTWSIVDQHGNVPREGRLRDDPSPFPQPAYTLTTEADQVVVQTDALKLVIDPADARLMWHTAQGQPFAADLAHRAYTYDQTGRSIFHYLERHNDEHYFGFGERSGLMDKKGRRLRMMNLDAFGYNAETTDPLYKHVPFYITYRADLNIAYGLFYDNLATSVFDLGAEISSFWGDYRYYMAEDGDIDYYMLYGPTIEAVIEQYTALTGRPVLMPRWSLGYLGSTMYYTEMADSQEQLKRFAELCEEHDIPCDLFHLSSGYTTDEQGRRNVFTWNRSRIPEPAQMIQTFHDAGIRLAPNIKPWLLTVHPEYEAMKKAGGFLRDPETGDPILSRFWSGGAYESSVGSYIDFTSEVGFAWWQEHIQEMLLSIGVDALWNDNNEFEVWDDEAVCAGFGQPLRVGLARPLQTLLMARASYEAALKHNPQTRPFIVSRAGGPGLQRYAQTWSGDNMTSWHTLRYNIPMGLGLGLSGIPNTGHDVGGFGGPAPDPELFVRWIQNGIFHPRFTIHSWNADGTVNEPWMHESVLPIVRGLLRFRYRLIPYLYNVMVESHLTGHPIIRPLVYHFAHDPRCHTESFDFLLGSHLLVASVLEPGARTRQVYLPQGTWWCDFYNGTWYEGGQTIEVDTPLERIPLMVADGGMIPMGPLMRHVGEKADDTREVYVYLRFGSEAEFMLREDDGTTLAYQQGAYTDVKLSVSRENGALVAQAERQHNGYPLPYQHITFIIATDHEPGVQGAVQEDGRWRVVVPVL